jgi:ribonuclease VapC
VTGAVRQALERELAELEQDVQARERRLDAALGRLDALRRRDITSDHDLYERPTTIFMTTREAQSCDSGSRYVSPPCNTVGRARTLLGEPERSQFKRLLLEHEPRISAGTLIETLQVVQLALGPEALSGVDTLLKTTGAEIVPVDANQVAMAGQGMLLFGKGRGDEPSVLNFGDLFAYALAKRLGLPLRRLRANRYRARPALSHSAGG